MNRISRRRVRPHGGFTLFEVLLVLMILIILTSTVSYYVIGAQKKALNRAAMAQMGLFKTMLTDYHLDVGALPTTDQGLSALHAPPENMTKWQGPYSEKAIPPDPWQRPYQYTSDGEHYEIWSLGPDGQEGTTDDVRLE